MAGGRKRHGTRTLLKVINIEPEAEPSQTWKLRTFNNPRNARIPAVPRKQTSHSAGLSWVMV